MIHKNIDHGKAFDWGKTSKEYALFRDIYPPVFYRQIIDFGLCTKGQRVLDLGTGTGVIPRNLYRYGAKFIGIDIAKEQIAEAKRLSEEAGMDIEYHAVAAEEAKFPDHSFDVVMACQCFFYFDTEKVMPALKRMLTSGGRLCILFLAWIPEDSPIAKSSEELVLRYNPSWTGNSMKRKLFDIPDWTRKYAFSVEHNIGFDVGIAFTKRTWNGRMVACRGVGASLAPDKTEAFQKEHLALLDTLTVDEPFEIPHYATMLILKSD